MSDVTTETANAPNRGWRAILPPAQWLRTYQLRWLRALDKTPG